MSRSKEKLQKVADEISKGEKKTFEGKKEVPSMPISCFA